MEPSDTPAKGRLNNSQCWATIILRAGLLLWSCSAFATPPPSGVAPVISPTGGFAIDGDLFANTPTANVGDWLGSTNGTGGGVLSATGAPLDPTRTFHFVDAFNSTSDLIFGGGLKWTDDPNVWQWTSGKASSKTDINNVLLHIGTDTDGHTWTIISADRASTSGESYIDFEFLQNSLVRTNNGNFVSSGPHGGRTTNDLLLSLAFVSGGSIADFFAWRWMPNGSGGYAYVDVTASLPVGRVFVALNSNTIAVPYGALGQTTYAPNAFAEAALDLTALIGNFDQCVSFGFKTIMVKTKSSSSSSASISDFIDPIQYSLKIGPSADAGPDQARCTEGDSTAFPLHGVATAGLQPVASTMWSVVSGTAAIDSPTSLDTTAHLSSTTATLRLTVIEMNGCTETDDVVLSIKPLPACSIAGSSLVCPSSSNQFGGPVGMSSYSWTITGNGAISGPTNARTISVIAGTACGTNFSLSLNVVSNGCSSPCMIDVMVNDTTPPTITCPTDKVLECPAITTTNATGMATASDGCGFVTIGYSDSVSNSCGGTKVISRTWTATDRCGNVGSCVQTITVRDTTAPTIICPTNITLECPTLPTTNVTGVATAADGCGLVTINFSDSVSNSCAGASVIARTWTAMDECGNSRSCTQTITLRDTIKPVLTKPADVVLDCPADTTTNNTGVATATDTCSQVTVRYSDSVSNSCAGASVITRTWTATDECSNTLSAVQKITVRDVTKPVLTLPADLVLDCPANTTTNATGVATAQDTCSLVTVRYSDVVSNNCAGTKVITRTWTATDQCSNSISAVQMITVRDITPPSLTIPSDRVLECPAVTTTNVTGAATASDGCGTVTISYADIVTTNCANTKVIARTWTAIDQCGNRTSAVQTITVQDTTPPTIIAPTNRVLDCPAVTTTNVTGVATASDGCGSVSISYADLVTNNCGGTKVIARTWTATDACGNTASALQTITVRDITAPNITAPTNLVLDCPAVTTTNVTGVATGSDGCGSVSISYSDSVSNGCAGTKVISRTWTATDDCGNSKSALQTITVRDITKPSIFAPTNLVLECPATTTTNITGVATASDGCGSVSISYADVVTNNCGGTKVIARTWTATDECGNSASAVQTITVRDTTPPGITAPGDLTLECPAITTTNATGVATASDGCGSVTISYSDVVSNSCAGNKVISRIWTATDQCGNSASDVQTITVRDTIKPSLTVPTNVVLECPSTNTGTNFTGVAIAQDGCSSVTVAYNDAVTTNCGATKLIARTWTATDQCGNSISGVQTITVRDTTAPNITAPANLVLECPANTTTNATGVATASDGCGSVTISYSDSVSNSCAGTKVISRTWRATDQCGNNRSAVQTITVRDITPPTMTAPANVTVECGSSTTTNATGAATATDGCGSVTISYSDSVSNNCGGTRVISRTWTVSDQCGNSASALQTITVVDTTSPSLTLPANRVLQCPGDTRTSVTGVATATDACGSVTISYSDAVSNSCGLTRTVWRTWTATDQCGHTTNGVQTIAVIDTTKPTITCPNITFQCVGDIPPAYTNLAQFLAAGGTATDSCSSGLTFALISDSGLVGRCPGIVTRVYRVTDDCGNFADGTQRITMDDTIPPVLVCPTNTIVECGNSLNPTNIGSATATDNCSTNVTITYSDVPVGSSYSINFYAADPAANSGPYSPTYLKLSPSSLPCAITNGRAQDPLRNAVAYATNGQLDALTSISGETLYLGQIVPYEVVLNMSGAPGPERGTVEFTIDWATHTTSNDRFGFDTNYMVYCAFVDTADPGALDPNQNARVERVTSRIVNRGSVDEQIEGTFRVSGLDAGDQVVVEMWLVLDSTLVHAGGGIAAQLVSATKFTPSAEPISIGSKTISINANKVDPLPPPQVQPPLGPLPPQPPVPPGVTINVIDRTWTATDDCNNSSSCVQRITLRDTQPPTIVATNIVLECPATDTSTNTTGVPLVQDACGTVISLTYSDIVSNGCAGTKVIYRTWTAIDNNFFSTNVVQTITVRDTTKPTLIIPADVVLECPATDSSPNATGAATAQDGCSSTTVSYSDSVTTNCGSTKVISRTWTATDQCGNATNAVQTITVQDTTKPAISVPTDLVLECPADTSTNSTGAATASDGCGSVTIGFADQVISSTGGTNVIARTWTAADQCGNIASAVQTITVKDTTPPSIIPPKDVVLECPAADISTNVTGAATAQDSCGPVTLAYSDQIISSGGGTNVTARTWTATDQCGNTSTAVQTIIVQDTTPPQINAKLVQTVSEDFYAKGDDAVETLEVNYSSVFPNGITIGVLEHNNLIANPHGLRWEGNAAGLVALESALSAYAGTSGGIIQTAINPTDTFGGGGLACQTITLTLNIGLNAVGLLGIGPNNFGSLIYTSAGDSLSGMTISQILTAANQALAGLGLPAGHSFDSLTALVNSLNEAYLDYTVSSFARSSLSEPMVVVQCAAQAPTPTSVSVTAVDACSSVTVSSLPDVITDYTCPSQYTITRSWLAQDSAGNTNTCSYKIVINDTTPPTMTAQPDRTVTAGTAWSFDEPIVSDNCGATKLQAISTVTNVLSQTALAVTRTWEAADACGNSATKQQTITVVSANLTIQNGGNGLTLTWPSPFILQWASNVLGPYTDVPGATSPYFYNTVTNSQKFFRLRSPSLPPLIIAQPLSQTVGYGDDATLSVSVEGADPVSYQWQLNGTSISGATGSSLTLNAVEYEDAGLYRVLVNNWYGAATSSAAALNVTSKLVSQVSGSSLTLTWAGPFILQWSASPVGPYSDVPGATSPYTYNTATSPQKFFRLRSEAFSLLGSRLPGGEFSLSGPDVPGCNFMIQATTNLRDWVDLGLSSSPCNFVDSEAAQYPYRFYRAMLAH